MRLESGRITFAEDFSESVSGDLVKVHGEVAYDEDRLTKCVDPERLPHGRSRQLPIDVGSKTFAGW